MTIVSVGELAIAGAAVVAARNEGIWSIDVVAFWILAGAAAGDVVRRVLVSLRRRREHLMLRRLFGLRNDTELGKARLPAVFVPVFRTSRALREEIGSSSSGGCLHHELATDDEAFDIDVVNVENYSAWRDTQAALKIADICSRSRFGSGTMLAFDRLDKEGRDASSVSVGLDSNPWSLAVMADSGGPLGFHTRGPAGSRTLHIHSEEGLTESFGPGDDNWVYGVLARFESKERGHRYSNVRIVVGGLEATGTEGMGRFVADHWKAVYRLLKVNRSGNVVIAVKMSRSDLTVRPGSIQVFFANGESSRRLETSRWMRLNPATLRWPKPDSTGPNLDLPVSAVHDVAIDGASEIDLRTKPQLTISYRSEDAHLCDRLYNTLKLLAPELEVFRDRTSLRGGDPFGAKIKEAVRSSVVVLAIVGKDWETQFKDENDYVLVELQHAIECDVPILPVFDGETRGLHPSALIDDIAFQMDRHGCPLRPDPDYRGDVVGILEAIGRVRKDAGTITRQR